MVSVLENIQNNRMIISEVLNDDRQLKALIGLGRDDFEKLSNELALVHKYSSGLSKSLGIPGTEKPS